MSITITASDARRLLAWYAIYGVQVGSTMGGHAGRLGRDCALTVAVTLKRTPPAYREGRAPLLQKWCAAYADESDVLQEIGSTRCKRNGATSHQQLKEAEERIEELETALELCSAKVRKIEGSNEYERTIFDAALDWFAGDLGIRLGKVSPQELYHWESWLAIGA